MENGTPVSLTEAFSEALSDLRESLFSDPQAPGPLYPDRIHRLRVAIRRMNTAGLASDSHRRLFRRLGMLRDLQMQRLLLEKIDTDIIPSYDQCVRGVIDAAITALQAELLSFDSIIEAADLSGTATQQSPASHSPAIQKLRKRIKRTRKHLKSYSPLWSDSELHGLRIEIKKIRYALEALDTAKFFRPSALREVLEHLRSWQNRLGMVQDLAVLRDRLTICDLLSEEISAIIQKRRKKLLKELDADRIGSLQRQLRSTGRTLRESTVL